MDFRLADFGVDLTHAALAGRLDPCVGRERELRRVMRVLARKTKNNPVLLGEAGVGKTAVAEGLALRIAAGAAPAHLAGVRVFALNLGSLLAGTGYRGDFEARLQALVAELRRPGARRLLFIDELHLLGHAGKSEGGLDAANLLKPLLARGELPCLGASTPAEWTRLVAADPALERRFQPVEVGEPSPEEAVAILAGLRPRYEQHHGVEITDAALAAAVERSLLVAPERRLPDKAVDLLDEACALLRLEHADARVPDGAVAEAALAEARDRFDLAEFARLRFRVLAAAEPASRPRLDAAGIERVGIEAGGERQQAERSARGAAGNPDQTTHAYARA